MKNVKPIKWDTKDQSKDVKKKKFIIETEELKVTHRVESLDSLYAMQVRRQNDLKAAQANLLEINTLIEKAEADLKVPSTK